MKIVVGVDGSDPSGRAVEWCAAHAGQLGAEVVAVHAIDLPVIGPAMTSYVPIYEMREIDRDALGAKVDEWCAPLEKAGTAFRVVMTESDAATAIMRAADAEEADLIVVGRRGRGGFAELVLG